MNEIWKQIKEYPNYEISNIGNVRNLNKKLLKPALCNNGYLQVRLYNNKTSKSLTVHRLVALHFVVNLNNNMIINHIDGNKLNNVSTNLEWVTYSQNIIHSYKNNLHKPYWKDKFGSEHNKSIPIIQYNLNGEFVNEFASLHDAARKLKLNVANIMSVCQNKRKTCGGYIWKYK